MKPSTQKIIFWSPRILAMLFALFTSLFALDAFSEGQDFWNTILAFVMHLVPTFIVIILLVVAWRWEWIGTIVFISLGIFYVIWTWGRFAGTTYILMAGPLVLIGILFWFSWKLPHNKSDTAK